MFILFSVRLFICWGEYYLDNGDIIELVVLLLLLALSAFFSSAETALVSTNVLKLKMLKDRGDKRAGRLLKILDRPEKMLSAILIGNNLVNLSASAIATGLTIKLIGNYAVGIVAGILTILILVFGEISPKTLATRNPESIALLYADIIYIMIKILTPVIILINIASGLVLKLFGESSDVKRDVLTEEELRSIVQTSHEEGVIENEERKMINNIFDFGDTDVKDIMTPRIDMVMVDIDSDVKNLLEIFRTEQYTRMPVYENDYDNIIGIINVKDILLSDKLDDINIRDLIREPIFTYELKHLGELMVEMKKTLNNMAIVLDDFGAVSGLITMEDMLEEIFGDLRDEYDADEMQSIVKISDNLYDVDASLRLDDINDALGLSLESDDYESLGGLIIGNMDRLPDIGDEVDLGSIHLAVEKMDKNRIDRVSLMIKELENEV